MLAIPAVTFVFGLTFRSLGLDANRGSLVGLGYGSVLAMLIAVWLTRSTARALMVEGRRLNELMGAVNILPQLLAALGVIFTAARLGDFIAGGIVRLVPAENLFLFVVANCLSMTVLTMVLGNSFAAFPVIATAVLVPLIIRRLEPTLPRLRSHAQRGRVWHADDADGRELQSRAGRVAGNEKRSTQVIRAQIPVAIALWAVHVVLMWA